MTRETTLPPDEKIGEVDPALAAGAAVDDEPLQQDESDEAEDGDDAETPDVGAVAEELADKERLAAALAEDVPVEEPVRGLPEETADEADAHYADPDPNAEPPEIDPRKLDMDAMKVVRRLHAQGHEAYLVGGCVRDLLLGGKPKDFDVATSAHPGEVRAVFRNCRLIGRRFRLAHVYFKGGKIIEVSTFRANPTEVEEQAAAAALAAGEAPREPEEGDDDLLITQDNVFGSAEEDARRRDFTINGLFYDVRAGKVIDYVRGKRDLERREIRTIGDPEVRLREDPVRLLRAVRFACKLGLDLESRTYAAMEGAVEDLPRCAAPRLLEETFRLIRGGAAAPSLKLLAALDALKVLLPPIDEYLRKGGAEAEKNFYSQVEAMDRHIKSGEPLEDAILMAVLLLPIADANGTPEPVEGGKPPTLAANIEDLLERLVKDSRLPRRIAERCRMLLLAQPTLSGQRRRRGPLGAFRRHPLFKEALTVFGISVEATGLYREQLEQWRQGGAPEVEAGAPGPKKRRRRRRRRGGGPGGGGPGAEGGGSEGGGGESSSGPSDSAP